MPRDLTQDSLGRERGWRLDLLNHLVQRRLLLLLRFPLLLCLVSGLLYAPWRRHRGLFDTVSLAALVVLLVVEGSDVAAT